jgi:hypothetical protein
MKTLLTAVFVLFILNACGTSDDDINTQQSRVCEFRCNLAPDVGPCKAYIPRYYFDHTGGKCKQFIWGGCDGVVPFQTLEECNECQCVKSNPE